MDLEKLKQSALEWWSWWETQSASRRILLSCGGLAMLGLLGIVWWSAQPEYRALYPNLPAEDLGPITAKLKSKGIPYRLDSSGTLFVRAEQAAQIHVDLSSDGTIGNAKLGKGLERFEQPMLGATPFDRDVNLLHAQQSDLARAIMNVDPIVYARVFIAKSQTSLFMRERKPATASILLKLRPGGTLDRRALHALASFVAGSVDGLHIDDVRIMDGTKKTLFESHDSDSGYGGSVVEHQKELESYLSDRAQKMLTDVLGPGRVVVTVRADLSTKLLKERSEIPMAEGKFIKKEQISNSTQKGSSLSSNGGTPGVSANLNRASKAGEGGGSNSVTESGTSEFAFPIRYQEIIQKYGEIERLSIAAVVDLSSGKEGEPLMNPEAVQELIKNATGFKVGRDQIQLAEFKMPAIATDSLDEQWQSHQQLQTILTIVRNGSIAAVTLCIGGMGVVYMRRKLFVAAAAATVAARNSAEPDRLERISAELGRNPEVLAKVLSRWIEQSDAPVRAAA